MKKQGGLQLYFRFGRGLMRALRVLGALVGAIQALIERSHAQRSQKRAYIPTLVAFKQSQGPRVLSITVEKLCYHWKKILHTL